MELGLIIIILTLYAFIGISWAMADPYGTHAGHIFWWPIYFVRFLITSFWDALRGI